MAAVTVDAGAKNSFYSAGNIGWSARSLFAYRTVIQQLVGATAQNFGNAATTTARAQSFTPGSALNLSEVRIVLNKTLAPVDNVTLEIRADSGANTVSATVLATSDTIYNGANVSTSASWVSFKFITPVSLSASTKYWIVVQRSGAVDASNFYGWRSTNTSAYAGGGLSTLNTGTWGAESATVDHTFQLIQQTPIAYYSLTQDTSLHVFKSTDAVTWTEQDSANAPTVTNANFPFDATDTITGPYLMTGYLTATNTAAVKQFDMSSDTWASGTWGTTPPSTVSNERNIRVSVDALYASPAPFALDLHYTDSADDADLAYQRSSAGAAGAWAAKVSVLAATSTEASLVADVVSDKSGFGYAHRFYYDCANDDYSMRSLTGATQGTETDLSTAAADVETEHAAATYQIYQNGSGVDTIIAAFIDAAGTLQERILNLEVTSASVTMAADNAVDSATTTAGRQLSTARYDGTNYIAVNVSGTGISYYTSTVAGTWSSATSFVSGLTNCTLSRILSIEGVGLAVVYTDNGDAKIDWIAVAGGSSPVLEATSGNGTSTATASALTLPSQSLASSASVGASTVAASRLVLPSQSLAASSAVGTSTVAASRLIEPSQALAGSSAGNSTATGDHLTVTHAPVGSAAGTSTVAASTLVLPSQALTATVAGTSTADASRLVLPSQALAATSAGTSTAAADTLITPVILEGTSAGNSTADATRLIVPFTLAATVAGDSTSSADHLTVAHAIAGASDGTSTADASRLIVPFGLAGASTGTSSAAADHLFVVHALEGSSAGTSTAMMITSPVSPVLEGSSAGTSSAIATQLIEIHALAGLVSGVSSSTASQLLISHLLAGASAGSSMAEATRLIVAQMLEGLSVGASTVAALILSTGPDGTLTANIQLIPVLTAAVTVESVLSANVQLLSVLSYTLTLEDTLSANVTILPVVSSTLELVP